MSDVVSYWFSQWFVHLLLFTQFTHRKGENQEENAIMAKCDFIRHFNATLDTSRLQLWHRENGFHFILLSINYVNFTSLPLVPFTSLVKNHLRQVLPGVTEEARPPSSPWQRPLVTEHGSHCECTTVDVVEEHYSSDTEAISVLECA